MKMLLLTLLMEMNHGQVTNSIECRYEGSIVLELLVKRVIVIAITLCHEAMVEEVINLCLIKPFLHFFTFFLKIFIILLLFTFFVIVQVDDRGENDGDGVPLDQSMKQLAQFDEKVLIAQVSLMNHVHMIDIFCQSLLCCW